jgi:hypothetical protein
MKQRIVIGGKKEILIALIVIVFMVSLVAACSTAPKKVWSKPGFTQAEFTKDKNRCMHLAEQGESSTPKIHAGGAFCLDYYCEQGASQETIVINWDLFNECMEENGWSLAEKKK